MVATESLCRQEILTPVQLPVEGVGVGILAPDNGKTEVVKAVVEKVLQKEHPKDRLENQILMVAGIEKKPPQKVAEKEECEIQDIQTTARSLRVLEEARLDPNHLVVGNPNAVQTGLDTQGTLVATGIRQIVADLGVAVLQKKEELTSLVTEGRKQQQEDDEQIKRQLELRNAVSLELQKAALKLAPLTTKAMDSLKITCLPEAKEECVTLVTCRVVDELPTK